MKWLSIVVRSRHFCRGLSRDRPHALGAEPTNPLRDRICWSSRKRSSVSVGLRASAHPYLLVFAQALIRSVGLRASAHPYLLVFAQALIRSVGLRASAHPICWSSRKRSSDLLVFAQALIRSVGLRASAHPPGFQSTSPSGLATRDRMNSRSDSRLRYSAGSTLTESSWVSTACHAERSARRATVRATCSSAESGVPPGSTNEFRAGRGSLNWSHNDSNRSM